MTSTIKRQGLFLTTLLVAAFMGQFDFFIVNVAAPAIQGALSASEAELELVVGGYAFAYASGLITGGRLGDIYGHRKMYLWGLALFAATSLLCGLAGSAGFLVFARILGFRRRGHDPAGSRSNQYRVTRRTTRMGYGLVWSCHGNGLDRRPNPWRLVRSR